MTTGSNALSLADAIAAWRPMLERQRETWFFCENGETVQSVLAELRTPVLKDHVTTLRAFARKLVTERCPDLRILTVEEQTAIFYHIIRNLPWGRKAKSLPIALVSDLIGRYNFFREHCIDFSSYLDDRKRPKHQLLATIFHEYERYCGDTLLDDVGVLKKAVELLDEDNPVRSGVIYHIQPADLLTQTLLDAVAANRDVREFGRPECRIAVPEPLVKPMLKYRTAKDEIEATLEKIACLLESGAEPADILIITPDLASSARIVGDVVGDFYYRKDGRSLPVRCTNLGTPLGSFPIVQCVVAALAAVQNGRFALEDLQTVASSLYFPARKSTVSVDGLAKFAVVANVAESEHEWRRAVDRMGTDREYADTGAGIGDLIDWLKEIGDVSENPTFRSRTNALETWLIKAGWMSCPVSCDAEDQARGLLLTYLASLADAATGDLPCDASTYATNLHEFLQNAAVPVVAGRGEAIRLCKLREASDLSAKHVFIVGLTAANIPSLMSTLSPFSMKQTAEICRRPDGTPFRFAELQYELERRNFAAALQTATESLTLSCHLFDGSSNTAPSSFMTKLGEPEEPESLLIAHSLWYDQIEAGAAVKDGRPLVRPMLGLHDPESTAAVIVRETCGYASDFSASSVRKIFDDAFRDHVYSATEIEEYLTCPYRWYLHRFVRLQNPQDKYAESSANGTLVHAALEKFIGENAERLREMSAAEAETNVLACVRSEFSRYPFISSPSWTARIRQMLGEAYDGQPSVFRQFAEDEVGYAQEGWFSIPPETDPETGQVVAPGDLECRLSKVPVKFRDDVMLVNGFIDRVMRKADGTFRIVDYKTGSGFSRHIDRHVQIPLYTEAFAAMHPGMKPEGGYYLCVKDTKSYGVVKPNLEIEKGVEEPWSRTRDRVLEMAFSAKNDMQKGIASRNAACEPDYCPFRDICRRTNLADDDGGEQA